MKTFIAAASFAVVFLALDMIWLLVVAREFYRSQMGPLMAEPFNIPAAAAFYVIYVVGVTVFVLTPALAAGSWTQALLYGALFGFVAYATYDLTNLATTRGWPETLAYVDLAWGTFVTAVSAAVAVMIAQRMG